MDLVGGRTGAAPDVLVAVLEGALNDRLDKRFVEAAKTPRQVTEGQDRVSPYFRVFVVSESQTNGSPPGGIRCQKSNGDRDKRKLVGRISGYGRLYIVGCERFKILKFDHSMPAYYCIPAGCVKNKVLFSHF